MQGAPWRPSTEHQKTRVRTHITDEEQQSTDEEEPEGAQMEVFDEEEPDETAEEVAKEAGCHIQQTRTVIHFHHQVTRRAEVLMNRTLVAPDTSTSLVKSRLSAATTKNARAGYGRDGER